MLSMLRVNPQVHGTVRKICWATAGGKAGLKSTQNNSRPQALLEAGALALQQEAEEQREEQQQQALGGAV